jgi:hypothetical protein
MAILDNLDNSSYPEPWIRQTPKGYEPHAKPSINSLLESQTTFEE